MSDPTIALLKIMMDGCSERQAVLANNVANANTPGFTRSDVDFRDSLKQALAANDPEKAITQVPLTIKEDQLTPRQENGSNVSLQRELGLQTENRVLYDVAAQALSLKIARMRSAIRGQ
jgi:flagellar basal-body rod protein FlgB